MTLPPDPVRLHERKCEACKRREWCEAVMDLIAQMRGHDSYAAMLNDRQKAASKKSDSRASAPLPVQSEWPNE